MAVFILDTDTLSLHQRRHPRVMAAVAAHVFDVQAISTVTIEEQIGGWSALARSAKQPDQQEHASLFLAALVVSWNSFNILSMSVPAHARFIQLLKSRLNIKRNDLRIAACALELGATVVTRNRRDFGRVPGLLIEDWAT